MENVNVNEVLVEAASQVGDSQEVPLNVSSTEAIQRKIIKATELDEYPIFTIQKTEEYKSVSQFMGFVRSSSIKFNDPIQRNAGAWTLEAKSKLIISILEEISIGEITVQLIRGDGKHIVRNVLDGKQRLTTIRDFKKGKFALQTDTYVNGYDKDGVTPIWVDVNGLYYDDLPQVYKDRFEASMIKFDLYEIDDDMKFELFQRRNNGVALNTAQLRKSKMSYDMLFMIAKAQQLEVYRAGFSEKQINSDKLSDIILSSMAVLVTDNNTALDNKTLNKMLDNKAFVPAVMKDFEEVSGYLTKVYKLLDEKALSKSFGGSKTIALIYMASIANREGRSVKEFAEWMTQFFVKDYTKSGFATSSGTAKLESVQRRNKVIQKHYNNFFASRVAA